ERLHAAGESGVVDQRDERAAHFAARAGGDLRGCGALLGCVLLGTKLWKSHLYCQTECWAPLAGAGRQCSARTSPNPLSSRVKVSPPSALRKTWPRLVQTKTRRGSAGLTATHHTVLFILPGSTTSCHVRPASRLRSSLPLLPGGPLPL